jgi:acetolactate synthase-1/2/3 large subunit
MIFDMSKNLISGAEALLRSLANEGVDMIFGYPGGTIMPLYDELYRSENIRHILVRHEQGAVHAAEGYARATGRVGVCIATSGPGATNLVTGIADALMDSTPVVCITAQVIASKLGTNFFQEADTISITIPVTKWNYQITSAGEIAQVIAKAFYVARSGRPGPVLVSLTRNAQVEMTEYKYERFRPPFYKVIGKPVLDESLAQEAVRMINRSVKPLIIAGQGVILSGAEQEILEIAETGNIPVIATLMGLSAFPSGHRLFAGYAGMHGNLAPNLMTQECDLILAVGMRFSDRITGDTSRYAPKAKIIHIDIDRAEFNKTVKSHLCIQGDAASILRSISPGVEHRERTEWMQFIDEKWKLERQMIIDKQLDHSCEEGISMAMAVDAVARIGGGEAVIVTDVGQNQMFAARYSKFNRTRSMITSGGLGTMGFGLPAGIGAKLGVPHREVVIITGDGGFQMSEHELGTIMQSDVGVKILLLNNSFLGMVRQWQEIFFERRYSYTHMDNPDFMQIASAYNIPCQRVEQYEELDGAVSRMMDHQGCYLLEVMVRKEENVFPMVPSGAPLDDIMM